MNDYSRPLDTTKSVGDFLERVLRFAHPKIDKIISMVIEGELGKDKFDSKFETLNSPEMRIQKYRDEEKRWKLRDHIIEELITLQRLENDDQIKLGKGGALPQTPLKSEGKAFILIGLPASGKSSIASQIADQFGAIILDSDYVKRKLPEYKNHAYGASLVHAESSEITFGFRSSNPKKLKSLYKICRDSKHNLVIPKIGQNPGSIIEMADALKSRHGYEVHLILVSVSKREATIRAIMRYYTTKRYVPLGLIFDWYGNDPSHSYYYLRCKRENLFESFGVVSTTNRPPEHTDILRNSPVSNYNYTDVILTLP